MQDDTLYTLRYGWHQAAIDYRKAVVLRDFSRESQAIWQGQIPAATTLLSSAEDISRWPRPTRRLFR